jgi:hypothetical protein
MTAASISISTHARARRAVTRLALFVAGVLALLLTAEPTWAQG